MASTPRTCTWLPSAATAMVLAGGALGTIGLFTVNSDRLVEGRFAAALASPSREGAAIGRLMRTGAPALAGSEEYWLGRSLPVGAAPVSFTRPLAVGDHVTLDGGAVARRFEVIDVRDAGSGSTRDPAGEVGHVLVVTCRDLDNPGRRPVRFLFDADEAGPLKARPASAL